MNSHLYYSTVTPLLLSTLQKLMGAKEFESFRLVGGTSLSLQLGHRLSVDIDLFSDYEYNSIDFDEIDSYLKSEFPYVDSPLPGIIALGTSYYIGDSEESCIKLDLFYTDSFIQPYKEVDGIRLATIEEITAMKLDVIARGGRKKDFWDIHEIKDTISVEQMLTLHDMRYPYTHNRSEIIERFTDFSYADDDFDPMCFMGKYWEVIKLDTIEMVAGLQ